MKVIPWNKKPIDAPGIYSGVPMAVYHGPNLTVEPSFSSTWLRTVEEKSLTHAWDKSGLNPDAEPEEVKEAWVRGRAAHTVYLGDEVFSERFRIRPPEFDSWRTADSKKWRAARQLEGFDVLIPGDLDDIRGMAKMLARHPAVQQGALNGLIEHTIVWKDAETGIWLKARPDVIPTDSNCITDLKTCTDGGARAVRRAIGDHGYHMQMALIGQGLFELDVMRVDTFFLLFVESKTPWACNNKPLSPMAVHWGERQNRRAIRKTADALEAGCMKSGIWPGYDDDDVAADLPEYMTKRLESEDKWGLLPKLEGQP